MYVDEDKPPIQFTKSSGYCVKFGDELVMFQGEPDSDGNMFSVHDGKVYRLTVKKEERKLDD